MGETAAPPDASLAPGLLDRAWRRIAGAWRDMASGVAGEEDDSVAGQMRACLAARGGEVSARNRAAKLAQAYLALDPPGRLDFLRTLAEFDSDPALVEAAFADLQKARDPAGGAAPPPPPRRARAPPPPPPRTHVGPHPPRGEVLVDLRAALLDDTTADPHLAALQSDLRGLLAAWFDVGFLELRRIDWSSPASLLERLVGYEAVHEIRGWRDLKDRLDSDRRCYAFFHPRMPGEPLIFVEVALVRGMAGSIQGLLDQRAPPLDAREADTAIFYSISNCQRGLAGISFGNFLIKHVVEVLSAEFRDLRTFATLSPIPGFRRWLDAHLQAPDPKLASEEETAALRAVAGLPAGTAAEALAVVLARRGWVRDPAAQAALEAPLVRLAARYLLGAANGRRAADPVAHFHLSNGARVEQIDWLADTSDKGARESATLMVNYLYDPARIEEWHEDYAGQGRRNASTAVRRLARGAA